MKAQKIFSLGILLALSMFVLPLATAATTIVSPVSVGNYTGTALVNVTTALGEARNATCFYDSAGGVVFANSTDTQLVSIANDTDDQLIFDETVTISSLTDTATYNITCLVANLTHTEEATFVSGITFDSTDPVVSLSVDLSGEYQSFGRLIEYTCTTTDAIDGSPTELFSVAHPSGDSPTSTSLTLQSTKLQFLDTDYAGDFVFTCNSTDYTGNIGTDSATVTVDELGRAQSVTSGSNSKFEMSWGLIAVVILGIWLIAGKKK